MLRAPGFLAESLVLKSTNTRLVRVVGHGIGFHRPLRLGGRVGNADTEIETATHGLANIESSADTEANADFFGHFFCLLSVGKLRRERGSALDGIVGVGL